MLAPLFLDYTPFTLRMTIGSVILMALTATGAIESLAISSISSDFVPHGVWVADRHAWELVL